MAEFPNKSATGEDPVLRDLLASGERTRGSLPEQLRHRIGFADPSLFDDELVARTRGLLAHLTAQLAGGRPIIDTDPATQFQQARHAILRSLSEHPPLLAHCHALALEYRLTLRLTADADVDPLLPAVMQELIASPNEQTSRLASAALAAQTRFLANIERMQLPLRQLPGELLHLALSIGRKSLGEPIVADAVEQAVRTSYDEKTTRLALLGRLVHATDFPNARGWHLAEAGVPLFLAGLSTAGGLSQHDAALLTTESQIVRLALTLRTLGCNPHAINRNLYLLHNEIAVPVIAGIDPGAASAFLAESAAMHQRRDAS